MPVYRCSGCASAVPADELCDEHGRPVRLPTADMTHAVHTGDPAGTLLCGPVLVRREWSDDPCEGAGCLGPDCPAHRP